MADKPLNNKQKPIMPASGTAAPKENKSKKKAGVAIVVLLLVATIIALAVMVVTKNLFGGRDSIITFLTSMDPAYETLQQKQAELQAFEADLTAREEAAAGKEASLADKQTKLDEQAAALEQEKVIGSFELYVASLSSERIAQFQQLGTIYSNMEPEQAAAALSELGSAMDMAIVIYYMKPDSSAAVLDSTDPELAAQITESLLK